MTDTINMLRRGLLAAVAALALTLAAAAASAHAEAFGPASFDVSSSTTQAGAHPDLTTGFTMNVVADPNGPDINNDPSDPFNAVPVDPLRDVRLALPAGLVGDPTHIPQCAPEVFGAGLLNGQSCAD